MAESLARGGTGSDKEQNTGYQSQMRYRLVIGIKNISSWSLRPWLAMRQAGIPFEEIKIELRRPDTPANIGRYSPSGRVPALLAGDLAISESLAILEYFAEVHPQARLWPAPQPARALARAVSAEMHAGFAVLREHCPMDFVARLPMATLPDPVASEVRHILALWRDCRRRHGGNGPFLFGAFSAADAMYRARRRSLSHLPSRFDALWRRRDRCGSSRPCLPSRACWRGRKPRAWKLPAARRWQVTSLMFGHSGLLKSASQRRALTLMYAGCPSGEDRGTFEDARRATPRLRPSIAL